MVPTRSRSFAPGDLVRSVGAGAGTAFYDVDTTLPAARAVPVPRNRVPSRSSCRVPRRTTAATSMSPTPGPRSGGSAPRPRATPCSRPPSPCARRRSTRPSSRTCRALERRRCATGELDLGPVQAERIELDPIVGGVDAQPAWLAARTDVGAVRRAGVDGLDPGLPVALAPDLEDLPTERLDHRPWPLRRSGRLDLPGRLSRGVGHDAPTARRADAALPGAVRRDQRRADGGTVMPRVTDRPWLSSASGRPLLTSRVAASVRSAR